MDKSELYEKKLDSRLLFEGKVIRVELDQIELPNGEKAQREVVRHQGAVCVVPVTEQGEVLVVHQYRYPPAQVMLEIPAGKLDFGEDPEHCARRELKEETGAVAEHLVYMGYFYSSPAILDEKIHMYLATGLSFGDSHLDEDEFVVSERIPLQTLCDRIMNNEIMDIKTQAAVMRVKYLLDQGKWKI